MPKHYDRIEKNKKKTGETVIFRWRFFYFDQFFWKAIISYKKEGFVENAEAFLDDNFQNGIGKSLKTVFPSCSEIRLKKYTDSTPYRREKSV